MLVRAEFCWLFSDLELMYGGIREMTESLLPALPSVAVEEAGLCRLRPRILAGMTDAEGLPQSTVGELGKALSVSE